MVLIVDDMPEMVALLKELMAHFRPHKVVYAYTDPVEALRFARENPPTILFVDIAMPAMNGLEFITELRETNACPVVVLSAMASMFKPQLERLPNVHFLDKPFGVEQFKALADVVLPRGRG